jgi:thermostable 8-oxoguanine DNA glycosylase
MQCVLDMHGDNLREMFLPAPHLEALPDVRWGNFDEFFTPAFWVARAWQAAPDQLFEPTRLGHSLPEELAACLLGGYGIPAEVGLAAFEQVRLEGLLDGLPSPDRVQRVLSAPLVVHGRRVLYRFARQKAKQLSESLEQLRDLKLEGLGDREFRDQLATLPGIGPKTASWITRNWRASDEVAILDIHICRACHAVGLFPPDASPSKGYMQLEELFVLFASAIGVRPSILDNLMWHTMRRIGHLLGDSLRIRPTAAVPTATKPLGTRTASASRPPRRPRGHIPSPIAPATS